MKYVRIRISDRICWAELHDQLFYPLTSAPYLGGTRTGEELAGDDVCLLAPCEPAKIVAVGKNYLDHVRELEKDAEIPPNPVLFIKPADCVIGPEENIILPSEDITGRVDYEGELALVISKKAKNLRPEEVKAYILGYTCLNDVTARDIQKSDGQWTRAKGFDTFAPAGPLLTDEIDPLNVSIVTRQNGQIRQSSDTSKQIWNVYELVSFISRMMTLNPGDVVTTGTPAGIGRLFPGDEISVEIQGIGLLKNKVAAVGL